MRRSPLRGRDQQLGDYVTDVDIADLIRVGDRVTILVPAGLSLRDGREYREKTGRAVDARFRRLGLEHGRKARYAGRGFR